MEEYNYFMKPYNMEGVGNIYPIKLRDYDEFSQIANDIIVNDIKNINSLLKIQFETLQEQGKIDKFEKFKRIPYYNLFDLIIHNNEELEKQEDKVVKYINNSKKELLNGDLENKLNCKMKLEEKEQILETINNYEKQIPKNKLYTMLKMLLHKNAKIVNKEIVIFNEDNSISGKITKDNFMQFRKIVMRNNLLYEPLVGKDKESNDLILRAIQTKTKNKKKTSREAIITCVCLHRNLSDEQIQEYTMYRLIADFTMISREHYNQLYFIIKAVADGKMDVPNLSDDLELYKNPYEGILCEHDGYSDFDKQLKKG